MIRLSVALALLWTPGAVAAEPPPPLAVYLNHVYLVLDGETYEAIAGSDFVRRELAGFEQRTTTAGGMSWTGTYLYGEETYVELFGPGGVAGVGRGGVIFGVDRPGELERVRARLAAELGEEPPVLERRRVKGEEPIPWFRMTGYYDPGDVLGVGVMEYERGYLGAWYGDGEAAATDVSRRQNRARDYKPERLLDDVTGVTVAVPAAERARLLAQLEAFGYRLEVAGDGHLASGPGVHLRIVPASDERRGVVELELALRRPWQGERELRFGRSVLAFDGRTATWTF